MGRNRTTDRHLPAKVYLEHGAYYFRDGKQKRIPLGNDIATALSKYGSLISAHWIGRTVGDVIDRYRAEVLPLKRSKTTRDDQAKGLDRLKRGFGHMLPDNVTARHCYAYQDARRNKQGERVPVAAKHEIQLLRHVLSKSIRWGVSTVNAAKGLEFEGKAAKRRQVHMAEVEALKALASDRLAVAIDLAVIVGQRRGDLLTLTRSQCQADGIHFAQSKTEAALIIEWSDDLRAVCARADALKPQIPREYLVRKLNGQPYTPRGFSSNWQRLMDKYEAKGNVRFTFHDLRSVSADVGTLEEAQQRLGHASPETTKRFYRRAAIKAKPRS